MTIWGIYSHIYDKLNKLIPYINMLQQVYDKLELKDTSIHLDAGCGTGNLIKYISSRNEIKIFGVDSCKPMLKIAEKKLLNIDNIILREACLNSGLQFESNFFDSVTLINVLYAVDNPKEVLRELNRITKPDGKLIIVNPLPNVKNYKIFSEHLYLTKERVFSKFVFFINMISIGILNAYIVKKGKKRNFYFFDKDNIKKLLFELNFKDISVDTTYSNQSLLVTAVK